MFILNYFLIFECTVRKACRFMASTWRPFVLLNVIISYTSVWLPHLACSSPGSAISERVLKTGAVVCNEYVCFPGPTRSHVTVHETVWKPTLAGATDCSSALLDRYQKVKCPNYISFLVSLKSAARLTSDRRVSNDRLKKLITLFIQFRSIII